MKLFIVISTESKDEVPLNITAPGLNDCILHEGRVSLSRNLTLELNTSFHINQTTSRKSIIVQATGHIQVYGLCTSHVTAETFQVLPIHCLGNTYYVVSWEIEKSEILILGLHNNTTVYISQPPEWPDEYSYELAQFLVNKVNSFETLQIRTQRDISGTRVQASKPIAVFSGNERATVLSSGFSSGRFDHAIEMLPPIDRWGIHFVITSTPMRNRSDFIKLVGNFTDTQISMKGANRSGSFITESYLLFPGIPKIYEISPNTTIELRSTYNILVAQFTQSTKSSSPEKSDVSMVIVPPVEQWEKSYSFTVPTLDSISFENYLIIMINDSEKNGLLLNDEDISPILHRIGETEFATGFKNVPSGLFSLRHLNENVRFEALLYGGRRSMAYYHSLIQYDLPLNQAYLGSIDLGNTCDIVIATDSSSTTTDPQSITTSPTDTETGPTSTATMSPIIATVSPDTETVSSNTTTGLTYTATVSSSTATVSPNTATFSLSTAAVSPYKVIVSPSTTTVSLSTTTGLPNTATVSSSTSTVLHSTATVAPSTATISQSTATSSTSTVIYPTITVDPPSTEKDPTIDLFNISSSFMSNWNSSYGITHTQCCACVTPVGNVSSNIWNESLPTHIYSTTEGILSKSSTTIALNGSVIRVTSNNSIIDFSWNASMTKLVWRDSVITVTLKETEINVKWNESTYMITLASHQSTTASTEVPSTKWYTKEYPHPQERLQALKKTLIKDKKSTAKHKRSLLSAKDNRPSARLTGGIFGAGILISLSLLFVVNDFMKVYRWFSSRKE